MRKIAILPVRSGSKRIPRKNFTEFCGIPLYAAVLAELVSSNQFDLVVFAIDAEEMLPDTLLNDPRLMIYRRKPANSKDESSSEDLMIEVAQSQSISPDSFIFLFQATNPFLRREYVQSAVRHVEEGVVDSVISIVPSKRFGLDEVLAEGFSRDRTQERLPSKLETGLLWGIRCDLLLDTASRIGRLPGEVTIAENDDFDIDSVSDLQFVSAYLQSYIASNDDIRPALMSWFPLEMKLLDRQSETIKAIQNTFSRPTIDAVRSVSEKIKLSLANNGKVVLFGNGGSAADSQHIAAEFVSRLKTDRRPLPAIALTTDTSALTAIGNDYGFEFLFERQVQSLVQPQDVVLGITTSGKSANVLKGLSAANTIGAFTVMLTGQDAPPCDFVDETIESASSETAAIQEIHIQIGHMICALGEENYVKT